MEHSISQTHEMAPDSPYFKGVYARPSLPSLPVPEDSRPADHSQAMYSPAESSSAAQSEGDGGELTGVAALSTADLIAAAMKPATLVPKRAPKPFTPASKENKRLADEHYRRHNPENLDLMSAEESEEESSQMRVSKKSSKNSRKRIDEEDFTSAESTDLESTDGEDDETENDTGETSSDGDRPHKRRRLQKGKGKAPSGKKGSSSKKSSTKQAASTKKSSKSTLAKHGRGAPGVSRRSSLAQKMKSGKSKVWPSKLEDASEADKAMFRMKAEGKDWKTIKKEWLRIDGRDNIGESTLSVRYCKMREIFLAMDGSADMGIMAAKEEVDIDFTKDMWILLAQKFNKKRAKKDQLSETAIKQRYLEMQRNKLKNKVVMTDPSIAVVSKQGKFTINPEGKYLLQGDLERAKALWEKNPYSDMYVDSDFKYDPIVEEALVKLDGEYLHTKSGELAKLKNIWLEYTDEMRAAHEEQQKPFRSTTPDWDADLLLSPISRANAGLPASPEAGPSRSTAVHKPADTSSTINVDEEIAMTAANDEEPEDAGTDGEDLPEADFGTDAGVEEDLYGDDTTMNTANEEDSGVGLPSASGDTEAEESSDDEEDAETKAAIEKAKAVYQKSLAEAAQKKAIRAGKRKAQEYEEDE